MSGYPGKFTFVNNFGQTITQGQAYHITSTGGSSSLDLTGLEDGGALGPQEFTSYHGENDEWGFKVKLQDGSTYSVGQKRCNYDEGEDSPRAVILNAVIRANGDREFWVIEPVSSNCSTSF